MIVLPDGSTWQPQSTTQHALAMLDAINTVRVAEGLTPFTATTDNLAWLMMLAAGNMQADADLALNAASASFDIALASDAQVMSLLPVVGTELQPATYSTLELQATSAVADPCTIPAGTIANISFNGQTVGFVVDQDTYIPANSTYPVQTTANVSGPVLVGSGQVTGFTTSVLHLQSVTNVADAIPGSVAETPAQARLRIIQGKTVEFNVDGVIRALRSLAGILTANVYFNPDTTNTLTLAGGLTVPPRNCRIIVKGSSALIAKTYFSRMTAPTVGTSTQTYVTLSGQNIDVKYDTAVNQDMYVRVYINGDFPQEDGYEVQLYNRILTLRSIVEVGQVITAKDVLDTLVNFPYAKVDSATVSLDNVTYANFVQLNANAVPIFDVARIDIVVE